MDITIRRAGPDDLPAVLALIHELAVFVRAPEKVTNSLERMRREQKHFRCLVAETAEKEIVGMAVYFFAYSTWVGRSLYLDDLYVRESHRGRRTGTRLLRAIFEIALEEDCGRVRWQVLRWNTPAIEFYRKCGAEIDPEAMNCDFDAPAIRRFASTGLSTP